MRCTKRMPQILSESRTEFQLDPAFEGIGDGDPQTWGVMNQRGDEFAAAVALGDVTGALADLEHALRLDPRDVSALVNRGKTRADELAHIKVDDDCSTVLSRTATLCA